MNADAVRRACAVLGVSPGAPWADVRRQYRALAKRWHPDRFAADAVAEAEAAQRMRRINAAYRALADHAGAREADPPATAPPARDEAPRAGPAGGHGPGRRLDRDEIDALIDAINRSQSWVPCPPEWLDRSARAAQQACAPLCSAVASIAQSLFGRR